MKKQKRKKRGKDHHPQLVDRKFFSNVVMFIDVIGVAVVVIVYDYHVSN